VFARKLIRTAFLKPEGSLEPEDVRNEVRAVEKFCQPGGKCQNIVVVLRHGLLPNSPYYYFDMELCDFNLERFADNLWKPAAWEEMLGRARFDVDIDSRMKRVWGIMSHVASGVQYIHVHQEIHRDLKPENSTTRRRYLLIV